MNGDVINQRYLSAQLQQIDITVRSWLRLHLTQGDQGADRFRGLYISVAEAQNLSDLSFQKNTPANDGADVSDLEETYRKAQEESRQIEREAQQEGISLRLIHMKDSFGLSEFEYQAFLLCLLPSLDLSYERIYGFLQDDVTQKRAGVSLMLDLLNSDQNEIDRLQQLSCFGANGTLNLYRLIRPTNLIGDWIEPRLDQHFEVPAAVVSWLLGQYFPEEGWLKMTTTENLEPEVVSSAFANQFELNWENIVEHRPLLSFYGPDERRRRLAAQKVAAVFGLPLLEVNLHEFNEEKPFTAGMMRLLVRDACLLGAVSYIQGWETILDENSFIPSAFLEQLADFAGIFILGSETTWRISSEGRRPVLQTSFPQPNGKERFELWQQAFGPETDVPLDTLRNVASQFTLTSGQIENAVFTTMNKVFQTGEMFTAQDLYHSARGQSSHHLGKLAQKIEPRYQWQDIILPNEELDLLHDIVTNVRHRSLVLEEWGLGKKLTSSAGIAALFSGEPGTGKTLSAQVIAAELQLDIYRIDLSTVVSKYIGETEKNLEKIFSEAQHSNAILFFDEADAIFGKRSEVKDAHDRYANIEIGYLLQRMEVYDGVTILATNLRTNIDEAFTRRLQFIINFPFPEEDQRLKIWKVLLPPKLPCAPDIDWEFMAHKYAITGGSIRNILVSGAFLAAQDGGVMNMDHLLKATRREMQKMGRFIKEEDYKYSVDSTPNLTRNS